MRAPAAPTPTSGRDVPEDFLRAPSTWRWAGVLVVTALFAANAWHLSTQSGAPAWDDAWYLEESFRIFNSLRRGLGAFFSEYAGAFRIKAPLIALLPLPLYALFGAGEKVALWANQALLAATLFFVFRIARALHGERAAWAAVMAAALTPILYGLSRVFLVECLLTALVAWAQWLILSARPGRRAAAGLGAVLGLGLLAKVIFPLYAAGTLWLKRGELRPAVKVSALAALAVASTWYAFNAVYVLGFAVKAGFGSVVKVTGAASGLGGAPAYLADLGTNALSWAGVTCAASLLAVAGAPRWRVAGAPLFLGAWIGVPFLVFLVGLNKDIRYVAPALPALAILIGAAAATLVEKRRPLLPAGALAVMLGVLAIQTFGWGPAMAYNGAPVRAERWDRSALVAAAAAADPDGVFAVALEHPQLNANNLSSMAAARGQEATFVNLGYAQPSLEAALIRLKDKSVDHVILFDGVPSAELPGYLNQVNEALRRALGTRRLPAEQVSAVSLAPGVQATVFRLVGR